MSDAPLLEVNDLVKYFDEGNSPLDRLLNIETPPVQAVDGVSFEINQGETFGVVGESGCGKSTVGQTILGLLNPTAGETHFKGDNIYQMGSDETRRFRRNSQIVFQDPFSSLNPRMTIGAVLQEPLNIHNVGSKADRRKKAEQMIERVGLSADHLGRYAHEFSGGQLQRVCIARALVLEPDFIVLDEPVSALDVSVQAQVLNLLNDLQQDFGLTYLFIAHDLGVVQYLCDRIAVMYLGQIAEIGPTDRIFEHPAHPYTQALLESIPRATLEEQHRQITGVSGDVPSPRDPPIGCRFHTRCPKVIQPEGMDLNQENWRSIITIWNRLENDSESLEEFSRTEDDSLNRERLVNDFTTAFGLPEPGQITDEQASVAVAEGVDAIVEGEFDRAAAVFDSTFTTVCRAHEPEPVDAGPESHRSACFLTYDDPPSVSEVDRTGQAASASSDD